VIDGDPSGDQIHFRWMRRTRFIVAFAAFAILLLAFAPGAFAAVRDNGGQGWAGETSDSQITNIMFITIAFFPVVIVTFSLLQWRLDKRKHAREDAVRAREKSADWRGGW
jgi:fatty acid desaturase